MTKQEFMAISLSYGLKIVLSAQNRNYKMNTIYTYSYQLAHDSYKNNAGKYDLCVPILHPLSDLTKPIDHDGEVFTVINVMVHYLGLWIKYDNEKQLFYEIDCYHHIERYLNPTELKFEFVQKLIEWHFDIAGLIEKGEAIDVNTLETNPYA